MTKLLTDGADMKKLTFATVALVLVMFAAGAMAADVPSAPYFTSIDLAMAEADNTRPILVEFYTDW